MNRLSPVRMYCKHVYTTHVVPVRIAGMATLTSTDGTYERVGASMGWPRLHTRQLGGTAARARVLPVATRMTVQWGHGRSKRHGDMLRGVDV